MFFLPDWVLVIPILGFLIFIHELGHFATAKWFGIQVMEFGFGFPPRAVSFKHGGTIYSLNWIPIGGFVKMLGEEDPEHPRSFAGQSTTKRIIVLAAGSVMNLVFPIIVFTAILSLPQDTLVGTVTISGVAPDSPADQVNLRPGDAVVSVNGKNIDNHMELVMTVMKNLGDPTVLGIRRGNFVTGLGSSPEFASLDQVTVVPRFDPPEYIVVESVGDSSREILLSTARRYDHRLNVGDTMTQGAVGVMIGTTNPRVVKKSYPVWESFPMSFNRVADVLILTKNGITSWVSGGPDPGIAGPIGIAQVTGEIAGEGISPVLELMALISISLGIVNLLPIPALDGGRLLFVGIEWVRRGKRISPQREGLVHMIGFAVLLGLIVIMSYFDIVRLLTNNSLIR